jgi:hypothetical protein
LMELVRRKSWSRKEQVGEIIWRCGRDLAAVGFSSFFTSLAHSTPPTHSLHSLSSQQSLYQRRADQVEFISLLGSRGGFRIESTTLPRSAAKLHTNCRLLLGVLSLVGVMAAVATKKPRDGANWESFCAQWLADEPGDAHVPSKRRRIELGCQKAYDALVHQVSDDLKSMPQQLKGDVPEMIKWRRARMGGAGYLTLEEAIHKSQHYGTAERRSIREMNLR